MIGGPPTSVMCHVFFHEWLLKIELGPSFMTVVGNIISAQEIGLPQEIRNFPFVLPHQ